MNTNTIDLSKLENEIDIKSNLYRLLIDERLRYNDLDVKEGVSINTYLEEYFNVKQFEFFYEVEYLLNNNSYKFKLKKLDSFNYTFKEFLTFFQSIFSNSIGNYNLYSSNKISSLQEVKNIWSYDGISPNKKGNFIGKDFLKKHPFFKNCQNENDYFEKLKTLEQNSHLSKGEMITGLTIHNIELSFLINNNLIKNFTIPFFLNGHSFGPNRSSSGQVKSFSENGNSIYLNTLNSENDINNCIDLIYENEFKNNKIVLKNFQLSEKELEVKKQKKKELIFYPYFLYNSISNSSNDYYVTAFSHKNKDTLGNFISNHFENCLYQKSSDHLMYFENTPTKIKIIEDFESTKTTVYFKYLDERGFIIKVNAKNHLEFLEELEKENMSINNVNIIWSLQGTSLIPVINYKKLSRDNSFSLYQFQELIINSKNEFLDLIKNQIEKKTSNSIEPSIFSTLKEIIQSFNVKELSSDLYLISTGIIYNDRYEILPYNNQFKKDILILDHQDKKLIYESYKEGIKNFILPYSQINFNYQNLIKSKTAIYLNFYQKIKENFTGCVSKNCYTFILNSEFFILKNSENEKKLHQDLLNLGNGKMIDNFKLNKISDILEVIKENLNDEENNKEKIETNIEYI